MAVPITLKSTATPDIMWGVPEDATWGIVQSVEETPEGSWAYAKNHIGQTVIAKLYDTGQSITVMVLMDSTKSTPEIGDVLTWDTKKFVCEAAPVSAANERFTELRITMRAWQGIVLT